MVQQELSKITLCKQCGFLLDECKKYLDNSHERIEAMCTAISFMNREPFLKIMIDEEYFIKTLLKKVDHYRKECINLMKKDPQYYGSIVDKFYKILDETEINYRNLQDKLESK